MSNAFICKNLILYLFCQYFVKIFVDMSTKFTYTFYYEKVDTERNKSFQNMLTIITEGLC